MKETFTSLLSEISNMELNFFSSCRAPSHSLQLYANLLWDKKWEKRPRSSFQLSQLVDNRRVPA